MRWLIPILISTSAVAQPCDYDHKSQETYKYQISKVSVNNITNRTYDNGAAECIVALTVDIEGILYATTGAYIYGPDISQKVACERAELDAKESIIAQVSPVKINSEKNLNCSLTSSKKEKIVSACRQWRTIFIDGVKTKGWKDICND